MGNTIILNAPMVFRGIWKVAKGFLDERTRKKIQVKGADYLPTLLEFVDEDKLPTFLGGKCTAPFPSDLGPWNEYEVVDNVLKKKTNKEPISNEEEKKEEEKVEEMPGDYSN